MSDQPIATIKVANDPEGSDVSWQEVGKTPSMFLKWLARRIAVDVSRIQKLIPIYFGKEAPSASQSGNIHIQTTRVPRIGIPSDNGMQYFDQYPRNVMMIWRGGKPIPSFFTTVPDAELTVLGLPKNVPNSAVWVIYPE